MPHPGFPTAAGAPQMSGGYIPNIFAAKLLIEFYIASVMASVTTTEYEHEVKDFGDKLTIRSLPEITSKPYVKGQALDTETPEGGKVDLLIDKGFYWSIGVNDLDKKQSDLDFVGKWATHAAIKQKIAIDSDVMKNVFADADPQNAGGTAGEDGLINLGETGAPFLTTDANIIKKIIDAGVILDQQNVPDDGRYMVLPSWAIGLLKTSDIKNANEMGDAKSPLRNGRVGMVDRFEIFMSNNLLTTDDGGTPVSNSLFGHKSCIAFASQMMNTETLKNPKDFGDIIRSLQAYGFKVIKPEGVGHLYISRT